MLLEKYRIFAENEPLLFEQISEKLSFEKGTHIIEENDFDTHLYFITKGFVQGYYTDHWGNENTLFLPEEGFCFAAPECIFSQKKATKYTFEALTDVETCRFDFEELQVYAVQNQSVFDFYNTMLKAIVEAFVFRLKAFIEKNPEERYLNVSNICPNLHRLSLGKYLASFLGISPNSLSRIRKRLGIRRK